MKFIDDRFLFSTLVLVILSSGCSQNTAENSVNHKSKPQVSIEQEKLTTFDRKVYTAVELAVAEQDLRLLATSGRRTTFPGIDQQGYDFVNKHCGKKFMVGTGDVLSLDSPEESDSPDKSVKSLSIEDQREQRKQQVQFMSAYNVRMFVLCQKDAAN